MTFAEIRREDMGDGYYTLRYLVYNGDTIGSYGVHYKPDGTPYGASRDYHQIATPAMRDAHKRYHEWLNNDMDDEAPPLGSSVEPHPCEYHDNKLAVCDGSSLVEVTTDEKRAFAIAAMMVDTD